MKGTRLVICLLLALAVLPTPAGAANRLRWLADSTLLDDLFAGEPLADGFAKVGVKGMAEDPEAATHVWAAALDDALVVRFRCEKPGADETAALATEPDGPVFLDDSVSVLLDVRNDDDTYYEVAVNRRGTVYDALCYAVGYEDLSWSSEVKVFSQTKDGIWLLTLRIPYKALGVQPHKGDAWGLNFARRRVMESAGSASGTGSCVEESAWSPLVFEPVETRAEVRRHAAMGTARSRALLKHRLYEPLAFRDFALGRKEGVLMVRCDSRGALADGDARANVFRVRAKNEAVSSIPMVLSVTDSHGKDLATKDVRARGKREVCFALPYSAAGPDQWVTFRVIGRGVDNPVYESRYFAAAAPGQRVLAVEGESGDKLLRWRTFPLASLGAMYTQGRSMNTISLESSRFARAWSEKRFFEAIAKSGFTPLCVGREGQGRQLSLERSAPLMKGPGVKAVLVAEFIPDAEKGVEYTKVLERLKKDLRKYEDLYWAVALPNDFYERLAVQRGAPTEGDASAVTESADSAGQFERAFVELVRKEAPEVKLVSPVFDPAFGPASLARWKGLYDIVRVRLDHDGESLWSDGYGMATKLVADVTEAREVWVVPNFAHTTVSWSADEVRQLMSAAVRCGATGMCLAGADLRGAGRMGGGDEWSAPERRDYLLELQRLLARGISVRRPREAPVAVICRDWVELPGKLHTFLAHVAGVWYRCVEGGDLQGAPLDAGECKVVFLPPGGGLTDKGYRKLKSFVEAGGTLIVTDGTACAQAAEKPFLAKAAFGPRGANVRRLSLVAGALLGGADGAEFTYEPSCGRSQAPEAGEEDVVPGRIAAGEALMVFEDGSPALLTRQFGKGRVFRFGLDPFGDGMILYEDWQDLFVKFIDKLGVERDNPVWRFVLPEVTAPETDEKLVCFTGNAVFWRRSRPLTFQNREIGGRYSYSVYPDLVTDQGGKNKWISFDGGDLTDRLQGVMETVGPEDCGVAWSSNQELKLVFDLRQERDLRRVDVYLSGAGVKAALEVSADGASWRTVAEHDGQIENGLMRFGPFVRAGRLVRVSFAERAEGKRLDIVEVDIWGKGL